MKFVYFIIRSYFCPPGSSGALEAKMEPWRAVNAHNEGIEAQKGGLEDL
jgi:hypothetical protein